MSKITYVGLEPSAFIVDIDFQVMNAEQRGIFCSLILNMYCRQGSLPENYEMLARLCGCDQLTFKRNWKFMQHKFIVDGGVITHKRVSRELEKTERRRLANQKAAQVRWKS